MSLRKWGGVPSFMSFLHIASVHISRLPFTISGSQFSAYRGNFSAKTGKSYILFGGAWCFLGNLGDKKGQNLRYILISRVAGCCFHPLLGWRWWCPLGAGGAGCMGFCCPFVVCSVPLSLPFAPLLLWLSCNSPILCLISRFKGVFSGLWGACVYLYGLGALRGLWGFYVRVRLGGFMACGVFAIPFVK